jgi:hypothetical protein
VQQPRIPIWVVGAWPRRKSMARVLRYDGLLPMGFDERGQPRQLDPQGIRAAKAYIDANRPESTPFDIVVEGVTPGEDPHKAGELVRPWAEAGATWWIEAHWESDSNSREQLEQRLRQGLPRL